MGPLDGAHKACRSLRKGYRERDKNLREQECVQTAALNQRQIAANGGGQTPNSGLARKEI
jgi:hypothetical protein